MASTSISAPPLPPSSPQPQTPSPLFTTRTIHIPSTPTLSDCHTAVSEESSVLATPPSKKPVDRHRCDEAECTLRGVPKHLSFGEGYNLGEDKGTVGIAKVEMARIQTQSIRERRASDAGVTTRRDSIFDDTLPANDSTGHLPFIGNTGAVGSRPEVDEAIKGIPQGWEDDMSIAVPATPIRPQAALAVPITKTPRHLGRLQSFRALPQKGNPLAAWRGRKVSNAPPALPTRSRQRNSEPADEQIVQRILAGNAESVPAPARARLGLFTLPPAVDPSRQGKRANKLRRHADDPYLSRSVSSTSSLTTPTVLTARTSRSIDADSYLNTMARVDNDAPISAHSSPEPGKLESELGRRGTLYSASTASLPTSLVETPATENPQYTPSIASEDSVRSNRDRVLGLVTPSTAALAPPKAYRQPELHEVLPFAAGRPFSAWDLGPGHTPPWARKPSLGMGVDRLQAEHAGASLMRRSSLPSTPQSVRRESHRRVPSVVKTKARANQGWTTAKGKRVWLDANRDNAAPHYLPGWERDVLDLEARLHETLQDLAGGSHTFATFEPGQEPETVLDIGTGTGLWPISQSLVWRKSRFVGLDIVPVQIDLQALAKAEQVARSTSKGTAEGEGLWEGIAKRVSWDRADFLNGLPYDTGVFSFVHCRFLSLGISECHAPEMIDELVRVLAPGGTLEIVEMNLVLPPSCPAVAKAAYAKKMLAEMINPNPGLPIQFALPLDDQLVHATVAKPVYERTWQFPNAAASLTTAKTSAGKKEQDEEPMPTALAEAGMIWMQSALDYSRQSTGGVKSQGPSLGLAGDDANTRTRKPADSAVLQAIAAGLSGPGKWDFADIESAGNDQPVPDLTAQSLVAGASGERSELQLWAWVGKKKA